MSSAGYRAADDDNGGRAGPLIGEIFGEQCAVHTCATTLCIYVRIRCVSNIE